MDFSAKHLRAEVVEELLGNWKLLNEQLASLSLISVRQLLRQEISGARRDQYLRRLHGRYRKLNLVREREAMKKGHTWPIDF